MRVDDEASISAAMDALTSWDIEVQSAEVYSRSENVVVRIVDRQDAVYALRIHRPGYNSIEELRAEDSLAQEYIAAVIDSYYGLWGPWDEGQGGMWGIYIAKTREEVEEFDPQGLALLEAFLPSHINTEIRLDPALDQDFSLAFDATNPYTHKSQYFLNVTLQGEANIALTGNSKDNVLRGNSGDNNLDGGEGQDTAVYCDALEDHTISREGTTLVISGPSGTDRLSDIEWVHFADGLVTAADL